MGLVFLKFCRYSSLLTVQVWGEWGGGGRVRGRQAS